MKSSLCKKNQILKQIYLKLHITISPSPRLAYSLGISIMWSYSLNAALLSMQLLHWLYVSQHKIILTFQKANQYGCRSNKHFILSLVYTPHQIKILIQNMINIRFNSESNLHLNMI